jgi:type II secretory pathway predicted ATPase ExeA
MNDKEILTLYGLKWNPFTSNIPAEGLWEPPGAESFFFRVENLVMDGGFALICGEPGLGKSKTLKLLATKLEALQDVVVGVMERPQSSLADFYREMGDLFQVNLTPANRYGGFKALRVRWREHIASTLFRPVLFIDECQETSAGVLNEVRLLSSTDFDSQNLLTTVLSGDMRLPERFRKAELLALGSRVHVRFHITPYDRVQLTQYLDHAIDRAGAPHLLTKELKEVLADHAGGNLRVLNNMAAEILFRGAEQGAKRLSEKLFLETFSRTSPSAQSSGPRNRKTSKNDRKGMRT